MTSVCRAKTTEPIEVPFGSWPLVGGKNHVLEGRIPAREGVILGVIFRLAVTWHAVGILILVRNGAAAIRSLAACPQ